MPLIFPLGSTTLAYPPYIADPFDWRRSRRYVEEDFWKRVQELQSFGHAHSIRRTIAVIEYGENENLLTIQGENSVGMQKKKKIITL